ncbi:MAG: DNA polymerase III subunit alpha [Methylococcales bacterium]|nr:DNA polymerase III subunit alpha [Methylococcales bacterium]
MQPSFIHLRVHTEFSLIDGLVKIKPLVKKLTELQMPAVAVTDHVNMFGLVKMYKTATSSGIKPIAGADVLIFNSDEPDNPYRLTLLAQNHKGYVTLTELVSQAYQKGQSKDGVPMIRREWIEQNHDGLIALSGAMQGDIGRALVADKKDDALHFAMYWQNLFPNRFYLELQRVGKANEERYIAAAIDLAFALNLPVVATNDVRFLKQEEFAAHEVRVCINQGRVLDDERRPKDYTDQQYLRSAEEMQALFADIPEALENTVEIAKRCSLTLTLGKNYLPDFPTPDGMTINDLIIAESEKGLIERLKHHPVPDENAYHERLKIELDVITQMGFSGYFMIVADFIQWAKNHGIPVGPGRGSGAGSLVAYALKITDLDPIEFELLFERFLNPERVSMPDFDIDFCMDRRDEVIDYVADNYGRDQVSQIITYGSMAAKAVIRDVGRVLSLGYGFVDRLAKMIPTEVGITLSDALKNSPEMQQAYNDEEDVKTLIDMALILEGTARNAGKHAGGVVIAPTKLTDFSPLYCDVEGNNLVTQYDKSDVESVGLVKFDFLGLRTLTIIDWALQTIDAQNAKKGLPPVDISQIPRDDFASYDLLKKGLTTAVFQLESRGMKELIKKLLPDCFNDIIALVALFRPGPLESGMVDDYVNVKHKRKPAEYPHPILEQILEPTNGVILYQEQVMQIAQVLSGYTLGGADILRRAMGKKDAAEMAKQRDVFVSGAEANGVDKDIANYIFDLVDKFSGYGFNKSHSAAYALVAYQTAWLKAHYPAAFMAAVLSADMDNTDKIVINIEECRALNIKIIPPSINYSDFKFTVGDNGELIYGLGALKGAGEAALLDMIEERKNHGVFTDLYDLCKRVDLRKFNKRVSEALIKAGALDEFGTNRAAHLAELPTALRVAEHHAKMKLAGQSDLFGLGGGSNETDEESENQTYTADVPPWSDKVRFAEEKAVLGLFLTGHPIDQYADELRQLVKRNLATRIAEIVPERRTNHVRVAGLAIDIGSRQNKQGKSRGFAILDDNSARLEIVAHRETYEEFQSLFTSEYKDRLLIVEGNLLLDNYLNVPMLTVDKIYPIEKARRTLQLTFKNNAQFEKLAEMLQPVKGGETVVQIAYFGESAKAILRLGDAWRIETTDELLHELKIWLGKTAVRVGY